MLCYIYIYIHVSITESPDELDLERWDSDLDDTDDEFHPDENRARSIALIDALSEMMKNSSSNILHEPPTLPPNPVLTIATTPATTTTPVQTMNTPTQELNPDPSILVTTHTPHNLGLNTYVNCNTTTSHLDTLYNPTRGFDFHTPHNSGLNTSMNYTPPTSGTWFLK